MSHPSSEKKEYPSSDTEDDPSSEMEESPSSETKEWFKRVRQNFENEILNDLESNVCVFQVPRLLSSSMPEAYTPQLVGLGPYHHLQPHLREMQRVKLEIVKKLYKDFHHLTVNGLVKKLSDRDSNTSLDLRVRYHKFLNMDHGMLLWIMTVDALFLFYQLRQHSIDNKLLEKWPWFLGNKTGGKGNKLADASIRRDIMMLENQIPIFFVKQMLTVACETVKDPPEVNSETLQDQQEVNSETLQDQQEVTSETLQDQQEVTSETLQDQQTVDCVTPQDQQDQQKTLQKRQETIVNEIFPSMLVGFCKALSPLKETIDCCAATALASEHLLDILYSMVVSRKKEEESNGLGNYSRINKYKNEANESNPQMPDDARKGSDHIQKALGNCGSFADMATASFIKVLKTVGQILKVMIKFYPKVAQKDDSQGKIVDPAEEKVLIPAASSLHKADVKFRNVKFIKDLEFDPKTRIFKIPALKLGINSGVVIRNLVAYEAMAISGPLVFARFVEMMDGLINTVDDVQLLKYDGIINKRLKDVEVMHMFNGMSKCIEVNSDSEVDKVIKKVNDFYNAAPSVKHRNMLDRYVYNFWKALALASTVLLFLLMGLQTFCSAYNCANLVRK